MIRTVSFLFILSFVFHSVIAETKTSLSKDKKYQIEKKLIYDKKLGGKMVGKKTSPDGLAIAVIVEKKGREAVWSEIFGLSPYYKNIYGIFFSPNSQRLAIVARDENQRAFVIVDGKLIGQYEDLFNNELLFTENSLHFAYITSTQSQDRSHPVVVVDGKPHRQYTSVLSLDPDDPAQMLLLDSNRVIYFAKLKEKSFLVIDDVAGPTFDQTGFGPVFSDDSEHVSYVGIRDSFWYIVVDTSLYGPYPDISYVKFPPGSSEPAYVVTWPDSSRIFIEHQIVPTDQKWVLAPVFNTDGQLWANWASDGTKMIIESDKFSDSALKLVYHSVSTPWISENGHHLVYEMVFDKYYTKKALVVDGQTLKSIECNGNYKINFSKDGERFSTLCFMQYPNQVIVSVDDRYGPYQALWIDPVIFTDDGKHWATRMVTTDGVSLIIDGRFKKVKSVCSKVHYSPDGKHLAYTITNNKRNKETLYINDTEFKTYTEIKGDELKFSPDGSLTFFPRDKNKKLYRVKITPQ